MDRSPKVAIDIIIEIKDRIVLIERKNPPHGWALPGGFVEYGEHLAHAAKREAKEETGLDIELMEQFFTYSEPSRDKRYHTISTVFIARAEGTPEGADDARLATLFKIEDIPWNKLCFDHKEIIKDYIIFKKEGIRPSPER